MQRGQVAKEARQQEEHDPHTDDSIAENREQQCRSERSAG
jgi:hypothetical protein